jgi:hypothetical protein
MSGLYVKLRKQFKAKTSEKLLKKAQKFKKRICAEAF